MAETVEVLKVIRKALLDSPSMDAKVGKDIFVGHALEYASHRRPLTLIELLGSRMSIPNANKTFEYLIRISSWADSKAKAMEIASIVFNTLHESWYSNAKVRVKLTYQRESDFADIATRSHIIRQDYLARVNEV